MALACTTPALSDDFGPSGDLGEVRFDAQRLLARDARAWKADPKATQLSDVVVVKDAALVSWTIGGHHGLMGLLRTSDRWWDALDVRHDLDGWIDYASYPLDAKCSLSALREPISSALTNDGLSADLVRTAMQHNADLQTQAGRRAPVMIDRFCETQPAIIYPAGGTIWQLRNFTSGYDLRIAYTKNNAPPAAHASQLYARPPTKAEIIPYPTTWRFLSTAVLYFDLTFNGATPVTFQPGTTIDIWFPFVLDDTLKYDLTIGFADGPIGPVYAKPFDNTLHYVLPGFTATPGRTLMAEIDGNWP